MQEGLDPEKLADLPNYAESPRYDARERAALELADRMTLTHLEVENAFFDKLKGMFTEDELVELAAVAATVRSAGAPVPTSEHIYIPHVT